MSQRSRQRPPNRRPWLLAVAGVLVLAGLGAAWWHFHTMPPPPPFPKSRSDMDPEVSRLIDKMLADVNANRRDGHRWLALGLTYETNGLLDVAKPCLQQATVLAFTEPHAWFHLGRLHSELGEVKEAVDAFQRAAVLAPTYAPARWRAGLALIEAGDLDGAEREFRKAAVADPADPVPAQGLVRVALQRGDGDKAAQLLAPLIAKSPEDPYMNLLLGRALRLQGHAEEAEAALARGKAQAMAFHDPWENEALQYQVSFSGIFNMSSAAGTAGKPHESIKMLEKLRGRDQSAATEATWSAVNANLATAYLRVGRVDDAIRLLEGVLAKSPSDARYELNLALAYNTKKQADKGLEHALRAAELDPEMPLALEQKGLALGQLGRFPEAVDAFQSARALETQNGGFALGHGKALFMAGRLEEASAALSDAVRLQPEVAEGWQVSALVAERRGDIDGAIAALQRLDTLGAFPEKEVDAKIAQLSAKKSVPPPPRKP